jgi:hypothetical protein
VSNDRAPTGILVIHRAGSESDDDFKKGYWYERSTSDTTTINPMKPAVATARVAAEKGCVRDL